MRGFTLVEVAIAIIIVGTGSVALMQLVATCTIANHAAADTTTAAMLAQHIQEMLAELPLVDPQFGPATFGREAGEILASSDDVDDFDGVTFSPPVDSSRVALVGVNGYSQQINVFRVSGKQLTGSASASYTGAVRVRVNILKGASVVHSLEWVRFEE